MVMGAGLVTETVDLLLDGKTDAIPQEEFYKDAAESRPAPKIFKDTCHIDWNQPVKNIYDSSVAFSLSCCLDGIDL